MFHHHSEVFFFAMEQRIFQVVVVKCCESQKFIPHGFSKRIKMAPWKGHSSRLGVSGYPRSVMSKQKLAWNMVGPPKYKDFYDRSSCNIFYVISTPQFPSISEMYSFVDVVLSSSNTSKRFLAFPYRILDFPWPPGCWPMRSSWRLWRWFTELGFSLEKRWARFWEL